MNNFINKLICDLERDEKIAVSRRIDLMMGELKYMSEHKRGLIETTRKHGWTKKKLEIVFILNSFYQRIVRPLLASAEPPKILGEKIPIRYGKKILFNDEKNKANLKMALTFMSICDKFGVTRNLLESPKTSDVIWQINKATDQHDDE